MKKIIVEKRSLKRKKILFIKRMISTFSIALTVVLLTGCGKSESNNGIAEGTVTPSPQPTVTQPAKDSSEDTSMGDTEENGSEETLSIKDYYPLTADAEYVFEGEGNEYASYKMYVDFLDTEKNLIQTRTNNGGTETIRVIEIKDGKLSVTAMINECYYRDNVMETAGSSVTEVLLMEPLKTGTEWTLPDGKRRYISETGVDIETPSGNYKAIEVTTESDDKSITAKYYAPQVGLVKEVFKSGEGDMEVTSTLSEINNNKPFTQTIEVYYPDADEKIYVMPLTLSFKTNDATRTVLEQAIKQTAIKDTYMPLFSDNTAINSMYLGWDSIVYVDFSKEFVAEMNAGAGYESLLLQSVTNTLGNYYGVKDVYITIDGKPYESGHILMKEGETFEVNMDNVVLE